MSLDGLDAREVNKAYALALEEGGGWFLLKYTGRAEVGLLGQGLAGLSEVRESIERYDEQSPLYGFLQYRRRKVVFKYVPEGTSRLLLARMSIHFQAITEKLAPHDTIFSFNSSADLNDTALSASCSLHTASASMKSSNDSLRKPGLAEITEDLRENQVTTANNQEWSKSMDNPSLVRSTPNHVEQPGHLSSDKENQRPHSGKHSASTVSARTGSNVDKALPPTPTELSRETERPKTSVKYDEYEVRPSLDGRPSSQSLRPSTRDLHSAHGYKPKVKLGPRPSTSSHSRPPTAHPSSRATYTRPISTLPAGLSMPVRKAVSATPKSPQSRVHPHSVMDPTASNSRSAPSLPTKPPSTKTEPAKPTKRPTSGLQGDINAPVQGPSPKTPSLTPEKRRLMKALQLRQKQMAAQSLHETFEDKPVPTAADALKSTKSTPEDSGMRSSVDVFSVDEDSNIVHVGMKVFDKELPIESEISPTSITEPSDGPSTQASSISDECETLAKQEKITGMTKSSEQQADIQPMSADSQGKNPMPQALSIPQRQESLVKEEAAEKTASELESPIIHTPSTEERPIAPIEPDSLQNSTLPIESPPKRVSSLPKSAGEVISSQEVLLPAIGEDDDQSFKPLGLSYTDTNELLSFVPEVTAPQVSDMQFTSYPKAEDKIRTNTRPSTADTVPDDRPRQLGPIHSVKRVSETSDENFLSDDSFMEELKDAVVQEAKPISVSKSPITPVFPTRGSDLGSDNGRTARSISDSLYRTSREDLLSPNQQMPSSARSFSIAESQNLAAKPAQILLPTKVGVSSGISQRIKALEQLSSRPPSPSGSQLTSSAISPSSTNLRKSSLRSPPTAPNPPNYSAHKSRQSVPYSSPSPPPEADLTRSTDPPILETSSGRGKSRPESISVTAKIIRGGRNQVPEVPLNPSEPCAVDLYQSPLTVDHQSRERSPKPKLPPLKPPTRRWASSMSISSSSTEHQSEPIKASRRDSFMSRRSMSSCRGSDVDLRRSISETSLATLTMDGKKEERKDSKKSRLFKRMSNISSASRRSIVQALSPTLKEESIAERHEPVYEAPQTIIDVGDINVQFPDTLLWKRRHMIIDQGTLVLSPSKADNNSKVQTKRFSLEEFYPPYVPDQDRQELPNSVMLDFKDGSTLQCASENSDGQAQVLQALKQTHFLHTS